MSEQYTAEELQQEFYRFRDGRSAWTMSKLLQFALGNAVAAESKLSDAERRLEAARRDALEEAANCCESLTGSDATPTLRPGARMCLQRIRALGAQP